MIDLKNHVSFLKDLSKMKLPKIDKNSNQYYCLVRAPFYPKFPWRPNRYIVLNFEYFSLDLAFFLHEIYRYMPVFSGNS